MGEKSTYRKNRRKKFREFQRVFSFEDVIEIVAEQTGNLTTEDAEVELAAGTVDFNFRTLVMPEGNDFTFANMQKERTCTVYLQGPDNDEGDPEAQEYSFPDYVEWEGGEEPEWDSSTAWLLEFVVANATNGEEKVVVGRMSISVAASAAASAAASTAASAAASAANWRIDLFRAKSGITHSDLNRCFWLQRAHIKRNRDKVNLVGFICRFDTRADVPAMDATDTNQIQVGVWCWRG